MDKEYLRGYAKRNFGKLCRLLVELAQIPAPTGNEGERSKFCKSWLAANGVGKVYTDQAGNVIYPYHVDGENPVVVLMAHMDVVFPDTKSLPLAERGGKIFCPGVGDNSANLAVLLMLAEYTARHQPETQGFGLLFVCSVGEEGLGNLRGSAQVCNDFEGRIRSFYAFDLTMDSYTSKAVGSLRYRVSVHAKGGHSFGCFGNTNANVVLAEMITELYRMEAPGRGRTTYNVGLVSGGTSVNAIAQDASMLYEIRSVDRQELAQAKRGFDGIVSRFREKYACADGSVRGQGGGFGPISKGAAIRVEEIGSRPCEGNVDEAERGRMFRQVERAVWEACGEKPVPAPCSTDCNIPLSRGIPSVCVGMCRGAGAHTREEYIVRDSLEQGLAAALFLLADILGRV